MLEAASEALFCDAFQVAGITERLQPGNGTKGAVYTAFDGDHFYFTDLFSRHAFRTGWTPINPEACLGYKQAVDSLHTKRRVLAADVALLGVSDQLWVYTTQAASSPAWSEFAEGVLVEVLYWLSLAEAAPDRVRPLYFVDLLALSSGHSAEPHEVGISASALRNELSSSHPEVISLVSELLLPNAVPPVVAAAYHIADSKNAHWLREWMLTQGWAPIIPTLAFPSGATGDFRDLAIGWILSLRVSSMVLWLDPLDGPGRSSLFLPKLREFSRGDNDLRGDWSAIGAPKAIKGAAWPITRTERNELLENRKGLRRGLAS